MNFLWFGKTLKDSIDAPVVFVNSKNVLNFERLFDKVSRYKCPCCKLFVKDQVIFFEPLTSLFFLR